MSDEQAPDGLDDEQLGPKERATVRKWRREVSKIADHRPYKETLASVDIRDPVDVYKIYPIINREAVAEDQRRLKNAWSDLCMAFDDRWEKTMGDELPDACPNCGAETTDTWLEVKSTRDWNGAEITASCATCEWTLLEQTNE